MFNGFLNLFKILKIGCTTKLKFLLEIYFYHKDKIEMSIRF